MQGKSRISGMGGRFLAAALLFFVSLGVCLPFISAYPLPEVRNDAAGYLELARSVATGKGFTQDGETPMVYRPPLFSGLLGGWFFLTGTSSPLSAAVFQSLVHAAGVSVSFLLFLEIASSLAWATIGALFLAVNPLLVTRVVFVLQEPTLLLFTALAVWLSVRWIKGPSTVRASLAGAAWGLCTLAKVVAWFAPFLLLAMRLLPERNRLAWRKREAAVLMLSFAAVIAPWTIRNYALFQRFIPVNEQGGGILKWNVSHAEIPGEPPGTRYIEELDLRGITGGERTGMLWRYVFDHPAYFLGYRTARNAVHFAAPPRDWWIARGNLLPGEHDIRFWILSVLFHIPFYLLLLLRTGQWSKGRVLPGPGFLVLLYWAYWAEHAITWGDPRFGLAVYPLLVAMALPLAPGKGGGGTVTAERTPAPA